MKGSTLHRSGLTRENMGILANLTQADKKQTTRAQLNQYYRATKNQELDLLWGGVQKGIQKVHSATKGTIQKSPAVYLTIGFVAGVIFMCCITLIVSIGTIAPKAAVNADTKSGVAVIGTEATTTPTEPVVTNEKYIIKKGDTINGIAYRFYGKYDEAKIQEIMRINSINPTAMKIGQEILIPVER